MDLIIFWSNFPGMRFPWECHDQSQETNWHHCVTGPELPFFQKRRVTLKIDQSVKMPWEWELHAPIDHFHKWRPLLHSFVLMLIRPTALILKQVFFWNLLVVARLVGFISIKTKEYFIWPPLWKRPIHRLLVMLTLLFQPRWWLHQQKSRWPPVLINEPYCKQKHST